MKTKLLASSLVAATLIFSGCGESTGSDRLAAQQALDTGDYASAIATLESKTNKTTEDNMILASAYMGKAGFSFTDTMSILGDATATNSSSNFKSFATSVNTTLQSNPDALTNLQKAIDYYTAAGGVIAAPALQAPSLATSNSSAQVGDRDLFLGMSYLTQAVSVLSYLGDITTLQSGSLSEEFVASACAITKVYANTLVTGCTSATSVGTTLTLTVNGKTYNRLTNANATQVYLTNYNLNPLEPILVNGSAVTIETILVGAINKAFTAITNFAPTDTQDDITKFKNEIGVVNGQVTAATIAAYIAKQN